MSSHILSKLRHLLCVFCLALMGAQLWGLGPGPGIPAPPPPPPTAAPGNPINPSPNSPYFFPRTYGRGKSTYVPVSRPSPRPTPPTPAPINRTSRLVSVPSPVYTQPYARGKLANSYRRPLNTKGTNAPSPRNPQIGLTNSIIRPNRVILRVGVQGPAQTPYVRRNPAYPAAVLGRFRSPIGTPVVAARPPSQRVGGGYYGAGKSGHLFNTNYTTVFVNRHRTQRPYFIPPTHGGYFGIPIRGNKIAFVLDISGSMNATMSSPDPEYDGKTLWKVTIEETMKAIRSLRGGKHYFISLYDHRLIPYEHKVGTNWVAVTNWVPVNAVNIAKTQEFFDVRQNTALMGNGAELAAIRVALSLQPPGGPVPDRLRVIQDQQFVSPRGVNNGYGKGQHRIIQPSGGVPAWGGAQGSLMGGGPVVNHPSKPSEMFFMTDGQWPSIKDQLKIENVSPTVPINTICLDNPINEPELKAMAQDSGGVYKYIE